MISLSAEELKLREDHLDLRFIVMWYDMGLMVSLGYDVTLFLLVNGHLTSLWLAVDRWCVQSYRLVLNGQWRGKWDNYDGNSDKIFMSALVRPRLCSYYGKNSGPARITAALPSNIIPEAGREKILDCLQKWCVTPTQWDRKNICS